MATISEDYVSFETAKLLKEKWFKFIENKDELSKAYIHAYTKEGKEVWGCYSSDYYPCITMNMAMKWLREVHGLFISIGNDDLDYNWQIFDIKNRTKDLDPTSLTYSYGGYRKYELACTSAINYCLGHLI